MSVLWICCRSLYHSARGYLHAQQSDEDNVVGARSAIELSYRSANHGVAGQYRDLGCSCPIIVELTQSDPRDEEIPFPRASILSGRASSSGSR